MINLKIARIKARMTQKQLEVATGIKVRTIKSYETGQNTPPTKNLIKLADTLKVTTDFLLERGE